MINFLYRFFQSTYLLIFRFQIKIKGRNNLIYCVDKKGRKYSINSIFPDSNLLVKGQNNQIIFTNVEKKKLNLFPRGLEIIINGNSNNISIEYPRFKNSVIEINGNNNKFSLKKTSGMVNGALFHIGYGGTIEIEENCEIGVGEFYIDVRGDYINKHKVLIKKGTRIARGTFIRTNDGECLLDPDTKLPCSEPQDVIIGEHCWITSRCTILKGVELPNNTIVASNSLVNKKFTEENTILAGTPAKVIRRNAHWCVGTYGAKMKEIEKEKYRDFTNNRI